MEKLPPIEKVYEAWSAVADGRVALHPDERRAAIASSNGAKTYTVAWNENGSTYSSNDNATYWQGYAGYPVIAVLMLQGRLPLDRAAADGSRRWTGPISTSAASATTRPPCAPSSTSAASMPFESKRRRGKPSTPWARSTSSSNRGRPDRRSPRRREEEF